MTGELTPFYAWGETGSGDGIFVFIAILPAILFAIIFLVIYAILRWIRNKPEEMDDSTKASDSSENDDTNERGEGE